MYMPTEIIFGFGTASGQSPLLPVCRHKTHSPVETEQIEPIHPCVHTACLVPKNVGNNITIIKILEGRKLIRRQEMLDHFCILIKFTW